MLPGAYINFMIPKDPKDLATLIHGNRLVEANVSAANELKELWA